MAVPWFWPTGWYFSVSLEHVWYLLQFDRGWTEEPPSHLEAYRKLLFTTKRPLCHSDQKSKLMTLDPRNSYVLPALWKWHLSRICSKMIFPMVGLTIAWFHRCHAFQTSQFKLSLKFKHIFYLLDWLFIISSKN